MISCEHCGDDLTEGEVCNYKGAKVCEPCWDFADAESPDAPVYTCKRQVTDLVSALRESLARSGL